MKLKNSMKLFSLIGFMMVCCCFTSVFATKQDITDVLGTKVMTVDESSGTLWIEPIPKKPWIATGRVKAFS